MPNFLGVVPGANTASWQRGFVVTIGCLFPRCVWSRCAGDVQSTAGGKLSRRNRDVEKLWREFFADPSNWWDHRPEKANANYPDFKHKKTQHSLWVSNKLTPPWVPSELAAMAPGILQSNIFSWNVRLRRHVNAGDFEKTMELFGQLQREGCNPDRFTFVPVLNACSNLQALEEGRRIHVQIITRGFECDVYVASSLVDMYAKCGSMDDARRVFNKMPTRNVVSWSALILGYVKCGQGQEALTLSRLMQVDGVDLNPVTFVGLLNACSLIGALEEGRLLHEQIIERGYESNAYVANSLVDMYAKCGRIKDAQIVFNKIPSKDVVSWSALILGYVKCGQGQKALDLSQQMQHVGVDLNPVSFIGVLSACSSIGSPEEGRRVHEQIIDRGYECDVYVANSLVDMYAKCGSMEDARRMFNKIPTRSVVSWNSLILGYVNCGQGQEALNLHRRMQREGVESNTVTLVGVLNACASIGALEEGRCAHEQVINRGYEADACVANALVDMYAKCGRIQDARSVFDKMPNRDVISWSALILGYAKCGQGQEALELSSQVQRDGVDLNPITFVGMLNACASIGALEEGRCAHKQIIDRGYECDIYVANSLVDMYAKCGSIDDARRMFNKMPTKDVVSWSAMLAGYSNRGYAREAFGHFEQMCQEIGVNAASFVSVLSACSHVGLVDEGLCYFESMTIVFGISPALEHYSCVVDLLSRAGQLHKAEDVIKKMPCGPNAPVCMSLLGACRIHGNVEMAERVAKQVKEIDPENTASYVLLSNVYAASEKWDGAQAVHCERG